MFTVIGKLSDKSLIKSGVSDNGEWKIVSFLIEKTRKKKQIKIPIIAKGKLAWLIDGIAVGEKISVRFFIQGTKYKERYYTDCIAIEIEKYIPKEKYQHGATTFGDEIFNDGSTELTKDIHLFGKENL